MFGATSLLPPVMVFGVGVTAALEAGRDAEGVDASVTPTVAGGGDRFKEGFGSRGAGSVAAEWMTGGVGTGCLMPGFNFAQRKIATNTAANTHRNRMGLAGLGAGAVDGVAAASDGLLAGRKTGGAG